MNRRPADLEETWVAADLLRERGFERQARVLEAISHARIPDDLPLPGDVFEFGTLRRSSLGPGLADDACVLVVVHLGSDEGASVERVPRHGFDPRDLRVSWVERYVGLRTGFASANAVARKVDLNHAVRDDSALIRTFLTHVGRRLGRFPGVEGVPR